LVGARDNFDGAGGDADCVAHADEDTADDANAAGKEEEVSMMLLHNKDCLPDEQLDECSGALMDCDAEWVKLEFEKDARCSTMVF
jgi:hypothetical protein